ASRAPCHPAGRSPEPREQAREEREQVRGEREQAREEREQAREEREQAREEREQAREERRVDERAAGGRDRERQERPEHRAEGRAEQREEEEPEGGRRGRRSRFRDRRRGRGERGEGGGEPQVTEDDVLLPVAGIVDVLDNYAFVRTSGFLAGPNDVYVSMSQVKKYGLRRGDAVTGAVRAAREGEQRRDKYNPLVRLDSVNGMDPEE